MVLLQLPKDFRKSFFPSKGFKKLLDLPVQRWKAPLLLNYIPTYKSVFPNVPRKKSKSPPSATTPPTTLSSRLDQGSTSDLVEQPSTSASQLIPHSQCKRRRRTTIAAKMGCKKVVADDLLADIPDVDTAQPSLPQSQPKPKPKRLKKAQPKAMMTQIDTEDTLPISKLAKSEKTPPAAGKRSAKAEASQSTQSKRPRDLNRNTEVSKYKNFALTLQHSMQAIQYTHSFACQAFDMKKELVSKTKEAASLQKTINKAKAEMKNFIEQAKVTKKAQDEAEERPGVAEAIAKVLEVEAKTAEAQAELIVALAIKEAEIKAADEKAYAEGMADVKEDYKKQVNKDKAVSKEEAEVENKEEAAGAKSLTHPEQVDLTQDEEDEVSKDASPEKTTSNMPIVDKSIDQTLQEIDVELVAEKATEENSQKSSEPQTNVDAEQSSP
ncbi:uncharacterized protein LOC114288465 [Camellia sinensis]|uniref:uncharacterized protein LOC114288465 n=1 Tax=Camellia sinensis TaxID=4442 RepID=UPI0010355D41|nr:uncharacterized protein LOC114288465 [Camellia sinensis]